MPAIAAGELPSPPPNPLADDDDDFGEFSFVPSSSSSHHNSNLNQIEQDDDEWGVFVSSPFAIRSDNKNDESVVLSTPAKWEKPKGPIPLSFFGGEDESDEQERQSESLPPFKDNGITEQRYSKPDTHPPKDSISVINEKKIGNYQNGSHPFGDKYNDFDEDFWEFKDAFSPKSEVPVSPIQQEDSSGWSPFAGFNGKSSPSKSIDFKNDILNLYSQTPSVLSHSVIETDHNQLNESEKKSSTVEFYQRLREDSLVLVARHISELKKVSEFDSSSGQKDKGTGINKEIQLQEVYRELEKVNNTKDLNMDEYNSKDLFTDQLLKSIEVNLKNFEQEYHLEAKILSAGEDLNSALDLFKHSTSILNLLELASTEERNSYIAVWYSIISVCLQELQNGAKIWADSISAGVADQLITLGECYFVSLGEIYKIIEIMRLTLKQFKPWLLVSNSFDVNEIMTHIEKCAKAWTSGLDVALERVSNSNGEISDLTKSMLQSIKRIREIDIDGFYLQKEDICRDKMFCRFCLLPLSVLPEMNSVIWNGEPYFVKLANLWANKISPDPPNLPCIHFSKY